MATRPNSDRERREHWFLDPDACRIPRSAVSSSIMFELAQTSGGITAAIRGWAARSILYKLDMLKGAGDV